MMFTFLENGLNLGIFTHAPVPYSKLKAEFFENVSLQQQKGLEKTLICFIEIQSENMKATWRRSYHVTYVFHSVSTFYSFLNLKEVLLETGAKSGV